MACYLLAPLMFSKISSATAINKIEIINKWRLLERMEKEC